MFTLQEGELAVKTARAVVEHYVAKEKVPKFDVPASFKEKSGVFCTLNTFPEKELRGCIGYPEPIMALIDALIDAAKSASSHDPRFSPVSKGELDNIVVEVSLLSKPELIKVKSPKDYLKNDNIVIGRDGLIIEYGMYKGLLLPQVPVEWEWNVEDFLAHTSMKAGLHPDAWAEKNTRLYKFTAQVFDEEKPRGAIVERKLAETCRK